MRKRIDRMTKSELIAEHETLLAELKQNGLTRNQREHIHKRISLCVAALRECPCVLRNGYSGKNVLGHRCGGYQDPDRLCR